MNTATYEVTVFVKNMRTGDVCHKERINFFSDFTAVLMAQKYEKCADVAKVEVISNETGEVIYYTE